MYTFTTHDYIYCPLVIGRILECMQTTEIFVTEQCHVVYPVVRAISREVNDGDSQITKYSDYTPCVPRRSPWKGERNSACVRVRACVSASVAQY